MTTDEIVIELATALNRERSLSERESRWLEAAVKKTDRANGKRAWVRGGWKKDDPKLRRLLREGKRPPQIAVKLGRTTMAVRRRIAKLGLTVMAEPNYTPRCFRRLDPAQGSLASNDPMGDNAA